MKQSPVVFGQYQHLLGILAENAQQGKDDFAFLLWNTGVGNRVGHFRGHVELSAEIVKLGYPVLRFDLAGKGDSLSRRGQLDEQARAVADVRDAMDFLQNSHGLEKFILIGACSGAVDAHMVARIDHRVRGFVMLDTYSYETTKFHFFFTLKRLSPPRLLRQLWRKLRTLLSRSSDEFYEEYDGNHLPHVEVARDWQIFKERCLSTLIIYTAEWSVYYSYRRQFYDMFPHLRSYDKLSLQFLDHADHVLMTVQQRQAYHQMICQWILERLVPEQSQLADKSSQLNDGPVELALSSKSDSEITVHFTLKEHLEESLHQDDWVLGLDILGNCSYFREDESGTWQMYRQDELQIGLDENGLPSWFLPDPKRPGKWLKVLVSAEQAAESLKVSGVKISND